MAQRKQTPISGITTTSAYDDGSTYSLVNLRPKNGALHPVTPRKIEQTLSMQYDIIFVHKNNDYENWIGVINGVNTSEVYSDVRDAVPQSIAQVPGAINSVQQIGNTLSLITADIISYLFYRDDSYVFLGELPELPAIEMAPTVTEYKATVTYAEENGTNITPLDSFDEALKGLVNKAMQNIMYDGYHTDPPDGDLDPDPEFEMLDPTGVLLFDARFVRYAFRLYDGSLTKHSPPILMMPFKPIVGNEKGVAKSPKQAQCYFVQGAANGLSVTVYGHRIKAGYDFTLGGDYERWSDIIQSVDIFISAPLGISSSEKIKDNPNWDTDSNLIQTNDIITRVEADSIDNIKNTSTFYLLKSIPLGATSNIYDYGVDTFPTNSDISKIENLIYREKMLDDPFSHNKYGANQSFSYNGRLHIADVKTQLFNGFDWGYFGAWSPYNGIEADDAVDVQGKVIIETEISVDGKIERLYSSWDGYPIIYGSAFISFPDARAKRMNIYAVDNTKPNTWYRVFSKPLVAHDFLNLSYYLEESLSPIKPGDFGTTSPRNTNNSVITVEPNKIKVSGLNNPLVFPAANTYQVGNGSVLAMATNIMNVSDRNYGLHPLYVFTTQGIWTLNVGSGEVVYSTLSTPASTEVPTSPIVAQTPYGVAFATHQGIMMINGQSVNLISPQIEETPRRLNIEANQHYNDIVFPAETSKFSDLLKNLKQLIYNPHEDELIINTGAKLCCVLNFPSRSFYQSDESFGLVAQNAFPSLFVIDGNSLKNYAEAQSTLARISLQTRPLAMGMSDIKRLERIIMRGLLYETHGITFPSGFGWVSLASLHYSMDGVNFKPLTGRILLVDGNYKDLDLGLLSRAKACYFLFSLAAVVSDQTTIHYLDTVFEKEYSNTKMR